MARKLKWTEHSDLAIRKTPSVGREEYLDYMTFRRNDRPLFTEIFGPIVGLKEEWEEQGATAEELDFSAFRYRCEERGYLPVETGWMGAMPGAGEVLEETAEHRVWRDGMGRVMKLARNVSTLGIPMDWPVKTMDDWRRIKRHFEYSPERLAGGWREAAEEHRRAGRVVCVGIPGGYDTPRGLMGDEAACEAFIESPELIAEIVATVSETAFRVLEEVSREAPIDLLGVHEDMAGRTGAMVGPAHVREFIGPYYRRVWEMLSGRGARLFEQDSDGNMNSVVEAFLETGLNVMYPMEPAAGMDIVALRERYGRRLAFVGGLDKHVLRRGRAAIEAELAYKVPPMVATGGCVLALDHRIPNGTPLEAYRYYVRRMWELLE